MNVITQMAADTNRGWCRLVALVALVALVTFAAGKIRMSPVQDKFRAGIVIEFPQKPVVWVVT